jgi:hypothetical protein
MAVSLPRLVFVPAKQAPVEKLFPSTGAVQVVTTVLDPAAVVLPTVHAPVVKLAPVTPPELHSVITALLPMFEVVPATQGVAV